MKSQITKPTLTPSDPDKFLNFEVTINFRSAEPLKYSSSSNNKPSKKIHDRKGSETLQRKSKLVEDAPIEKNGSSKVEKQVVPNPVKIRTSNDQPKVESKSEKEPQSENEKKPKERTAKSSEELTINHGPVVETPEVPAKEDAKAAPTKKLKKVGLVQSRSPSPPRKSGKSKREKPTVIEPVSETQPSESPTKVDKKRNSKIKPVPSPTESIYESSEVEGSPGELRETCAEVDLKDCSPKLTFPRDGNKMSFVMLGIDLEAMTVQVFLCPTDKKNELPKQ